MKTMGQPLTSLGSPLLGTVLTVLLGGMLLATMYLTLFDLQWLAFLTGVLFAAVVATTSRASRANWLLARRSGQLQRAKEALSEQRAHSQRAVEAKLAAETRLQFLSDAVPEMILFVDRDERCSHPNRAFAQWHGRDPLRINGEYLRSVLGDGIYKHLKSRGANVLSGEEAHYEAEWPGAGGTGTPQRRAVSLLPYPPDTSRPTGFYLLTSGPAGGAPRTADSQPAAKSLGDAIVVTRDGSDAVCLESITERLVAGTDPRAQLVQALQEDHFILFAQKIQPLSPDAPFRGYFEVLLRLQEEEQNMVPPGSFFPVAERYDLMGAIDRWVIRNLLNWCARERVANPDWRMPVYCVNLSSASLCDPEFAIEVHRQLKRRDLPAGSLCFEVAEADTINHHDAVRALTTTLRRLGCRVALDGFGGASGSYTALKDLNFDLLKIDGGIIRSMRRDPGALQKARVIALAARNKGMRTVAQSVESDDALATLRAIGFDYAQGFAIGKPGPISETA